MCWVSPPTDIIFPGPEQGMKRNLSTLHNVLCKSVDVDQRVAVRGETADEARSGRGPLEQPEVVC